MNKRYPLKTWPSTLGLALLVSLLIATGLLSGSTVGADDPPPTPTPVHRGPTPWITTTVGGLKAPVRIAKPAKRHPKLESSLGTDLPSSLTPTPTTTPSRTPTPTPTSTPTGPPSPGFQTYLPLCLKDYTSAPTPTPTVTPSATPTLPPSPDVYVTNSTTFAPYPGATCLVGEIYNALSVSAGSVKINTTFYDTEDNIVEEGFAYACILHLAPGMSSPFVDIYPFLPTSSWDHYELRLEWDAPAYTPLPMEVSNVNAFFDDGDAFHVTGVVRNQYDRPLSDIDACVAMYDAAGQTIGVWWDDVAALAPDETDSFDVKVPFWKHRPDQSKVADYSLLVYNEYESMTAPAREKLRQVRDKAAELAARIRTDREAQ